MQTGVTLNIDQLRNCKLMIATPMYGGMCYGSFMESMFNTAKVFATNGLQVEFRTIGNESLIQRARNYMLEYFREETSFTHFLFIDSDIGFNPEYILAMLSLQDEASPYDILCAPYVKKNISWEKVKAAVDFGAGDENPVNLEHYAGDFVFNIAPSMANKSYNINLPLEVSESGTGFMMFKRNVLDEMIKGYPETEYFPDHIRSKGFDGSKSIFALFDCVIDENKRYLSEDYLFCQRARKIGLKTYICPWMSLTHTGTYVYKGSILANNSINQSLTADPKAIKK